MVNKSRLKIWKINHHLNLTILQTESDYVFIILRIIQIRKWGRTDPLRTN